MTITFEYRPTSIVENQVQELRRIAERRSWEIVAEYRDAGISGAKGRDQRGHGQNRPGPLQRRRRA